MSLRKRIDSFRHAFRGLSDVFRSQPNARIHLLAAATVGGAGFFFGISRSEWLVLIGWMAVVIALEALNTAIEHLTDLVSPGHHRLAGKAKDAAAAAVLVAAIGAAISGIVVFWPKIAAFF